MEFSMGPASSADIVDPEAIKKDCSRLENIPQASYAHEPQQKQYTVQVSRL
jgi:hypothetical protein